MSASESNFNRLRNLLWPIHNYELPKFIPMAVLMFATLFNQNILRILKDSILISLISAEITSFVKIYIVTPMAAIFVIMYAKMVNSLSFSKVYYYLLTFFLICFALFAFIIFPYKNFLHPDESLVLELMDQYPHMRWFISIWGNWGLVLFYSLAELWPNIFYVLLFWQMANEITTTKEAKRFYTLLSMVGNSSMVIVGFLIIYLSASDSSIQKYFDNIENDILMVEISTIILIIMGIISAFMVHYINKNMMDNPNINSRKPNPLDDKPHLGLKESFKYIVRSKYLWLMLISTAAYGLTINLVEGVWKAKIKELYPSVTEYASFNGVYIIWTGITIMLMTILGNNLMRLYGWLVVAVISPIIIMITGTLFFIFVVYEGEIIDFAGSLITISPLVFAVSLGSIQNVLSKGVKYSIWDTSREMLYIPLDKELRYKGKAAVDVISSKIGKSLSGLIFSSLFIILPNATYTSISSFIMVIFIIICVIWIYTVKLVSVEYENLLIYNDKESI